MPQMQGQKPALEETRNRKISNLFFILLLQKPRLELIRQLFLLFNSEQKINRK
jgi:hypothetical protein